MTDGHTDRQTFGLLGLLSQPKNQISKGTLLHAPIYDIIIWLSRSVPDADAVSSTVGSIKKLREVSVGKVEALDSSSDSGEVLSAARLCSVEYRSTAGNLSDQHAPVPDTR